MEKLEGRAKDLGCLSPGQIGMVPEDATLSLIGSLQTMELVL